MVSLGWFWSHIGDDFLVVVKVIVLLFLHFLVDFWLWMKVGKDKQKVKEVSALVIDYLLEEGSKFSSF